MSCSLYNKRKQVNDCSAILQANEPRQQFAQSLFLQVRHLSQESAKEGQEDP